MANLSRLPKRLQEVWEWQYRGNCVGVDVEEFFLPEGARARNKENREQAAKQHCHRCPVIAECMEHALDARETYGVWGGRTADERVAILADRELLAGRVSA